MGIGIDRKRKQNEHVKEAPNMARTAGPAGPAPSDEARPLDTSETFTSNPWRDVARDPWGRVMISTPLRFESWVPENIRADIRRGLEDGLHRYPAADGGPGIVVWTRGPEVQIYQYFPEEPEAYLERFGGDADAARIFARAMRESNAAMRHFVEERGWSPEEARAEVRRIDAEVFQLTLLAASMMVTAGASIPSIRALKQAPIEHEARGAQLREQNPVARPAEEPKSPVVPERTVQPSMRGDRGAAEGGGFAHGLSPREIDQIHAALGGPGAARGHDASSAVAAASRQKTFWNKAAALVRELVAGHTYRDANKRTAFAVIKELQRRNGIRSGVPESEMRKALEDVASGKLRDVDAIARRLRGF